MFLLTINERSIIPYDTTLDEIKVYKQLIKRFQQIYMKIINH